LPRHEQVGEDPQADAEQDEAKVDRFAKLRRSIIR
jgi:hypothetical protein